MRAPRPAAGLGLVVAVFAMFALTACDPGGAPEPTGSPTASGSASPEPSPAETGGGLTADDVADIEAAISSGNTAALEPYLADPVWYIMPATECCGDITPAEAITNLGATGAAGPWDFDLPAATIEAYRASPYGDLFPPEVIVGLSADGILVAFGIEDGLIVSIFAGPDELV